ncbi:hypothetical protein LINGRAHAP2_LOCUS24977 [Linum grandiflorum]
MFHQRDCKRESEIERPKKRMKVSTKKGGKGAVDLDPYARPTSHQDADKNKLYDQCLNAPTPVRYLKPKDMKREAERQKTRVGKQRAAAGEGDTEERWETGDGSS